MDPIVLVVTLPPDDSLDFLLLPWPTTDLTSDADARLRKGPFVRSCDSGQRSQPGSMSRVPCATHRPAVLSQKKIHVKGLERHVHVKCHQVIRKAIRSNNVIHDMPNNTRTRTSISSAQCPCPQSLQEFFGAQPLVSVTSTEYCKQHNVACMLAYVTICTLSGIAQLEERTVAVLSLNPWKPSRSEKDRRDDALILAGTVSVSPSTLGYDCSCTDTTRTWSLPGSHRHQHHLVPTKVQLLLCYALQIPEVLWCPFRRREHRCASTTMIAKGCRLDCLFSRVDEHGDIATVFKTNTPQTLTYPYRASPHPCISVYILSQTCYSFT